MGGKNVRLAPLKTGSTARKVFPVSRTAKAAALPSTPGLTPSPGLCEAGFSGINSSGPWIVSPPPLTGVQSERKASVVTSPGSWIQQTLRNRGVCSLVLAILLSMVVLSISLGGYVLLVYLAVSTRNPKYIAFSALLGLFFLVIIVVVLSSGHSAPELTRQSTAPYNKDEILRAYGLDPTSTRRGS